VGKHLAQKLGRSFIDTDAVLTERIGNIPAYLEKFGEELPKSFFNTCHRFVKAGYMSVCENRINLTNEGMLISNLIISENDNFSFTEVLYDFPKGSGNYPPQNRKAFRLC
jgi:hypothetical protein